eukprot:TRINITY_DN6814_c0_g1_i1.p1 TRINITY_DN6814_c0_g1~~TRINITY_DN6814_c0_g1_i1.p1  ORF type:complete len:126 (-),score=4.35 TRINITY_DN6814_c0_g1_i1:221-598(-)
MSSFRTISCKSQENMRRLIMISNDYRSESHNGSIPSTNLSRRSWIRILGVFISKDGLTGLDTDIEAYSSATQVPISIPSSIISKLTTRIKPTISQQRFSKKKCQTRIIGELAGEQMKWSSAHNVC